jgi:hypothetical protein
VPDTPTPKKTVEVDTEKVEEPPKPKKDTSISPIIGRINERLDEAHKLNPELPTTTHKKQLKLAEEKILEDPKKAYNEAVTGAIKDDTLNTSVLSAFLENATLKNDLTAIQEIGEALARHGRRAGQEVEMIKAMIQDNPTNKLILDLINKKFESVGSKYGKIKVGTDEIKKIDRAKEVLVGKTRKEAFKFKIQDAQSIFDKITCKI